MNRLWSQVTIAGVALLLGLLVVVQLRAQTAGSGLDTLSATELTTLVANLNTANDQLRTEIASLQGEYQNLEAAGAQGQTSVGQLSTDLARIRTWSGLAGGSGPGIQITIQGRISGQGVEDLLNELRNVGAEAIQVANVRVVPGSVVAGAPGSLSIENTPLGDPFAVSAIGDPETLTGARTRAGGIIAQLGATDPGAYLTVTPLDMLQVAPTDRSLLPAHGTPRL